MPSDTPAAKAIIFLTAPPISTPIKSSLVYTLNLLVMKRSWTFLAISICFEDTTTVVGISWATSSAWLGPDNTTIGLLGNSSSMTSDNLFPVPSSIPLAILTIVWFSFMKGCIFLHTCLITWEGTANTINSHCSILFSISL